MASPTKKTKVDTAVAKKPCPYGASCYRKNPVHFAEFSHPGNGAGATSTSGAPADCTLSLKDATAKVPVDSSSALPPCQYGASCYRKNLLHFAEYSHPTKGTTTTTPSTSTAGDDHDGDSGGDTETYDSDDDEDKVPDKTKAGKDILNRGMSLVKSFSKMTESERKELIQKAFEAKQKLQEELEATRKRVKEKEKELHKMQDKVNKGILLVDGEEEAMKGDKTAYFQLVAERSYKEGSADQIHFRLAESQFYRLLSGEHSSNYRISTVEYVVTPHLVKRFKEARDNIREVRGEDNSYPILAFHGTDAKNITPICEKGFKVPGEHGFHHKTDTGWYGSGVYFSEYPSYSMGYISGSSKLLLCQVLPGKVYECATLLHAATLQTGYDSHMSPCKKELVIFNSHHILPCYVVHYVQATTEFQYKKFSVNAKVKTAQSTTTSPEELHKKRMKAMKVKKSSIFEEVMVKFVGFKSEETALIKLVTKHMAKKGTNAKFDIVVAHPDKDDSNSKVIERAVAQDNPVVTEEYIYDCIIQQDLLDKEPYLHDLYSSH